MNKSRYGRMFIVALALGLTFFSVPVASQRQTAALRANDTELLMLGTAGGPPLRKDRSEPSHAAHRRWAAVFNRLWHRNHPAPGRGWDSIGDDWNDLLYPLAPGP